MPSVARKDAEIVSRLPRSVLAGRTVLDVERGVLAEPAKRAALPAFGEVKPELATLVDDVPTDGAWLYEIKYDGYRILAYKDGAKVRLASRNGKEWTTAFPEIADALAHVRAKTAVFDGEIAWVDEAGRTDFQSLQNALSGRDRSRLLYYVFDLVHLDGVDLSDEPLSTRKERLRAILAGEEPPLRFGDHLTSGGEDLFRKSCALGLEGIVAKRADARYVGRRGRDWVKVKCQKRQELVVVGFTPPKGKRTGLGALLLGVHEKGAYRYVGKVGTGFTHASLAELEKKLARLVTDAPTASGAPRSREAKWVKPELVAEVRFTEWTRDGLLRHPSFEGLRADKRPAEVAREKAQPAPKASSGVAITHPERVIDEASGLTKADLARYYDTIADHILPFAQKRPLMLLRCPDGNAKKETCFVQKHAGRGLVKNVGKGDVEGEEVLFVTKPAELRQLAQLSVVELHGWGSRLPRWDRPDWVVFDLDPDESVQFARVVDAARELREELSRLALESFVKTTGGKGLHVVVPLRPVHDWAAIEAFATLIANGMVKRSPKDYVATMRLAARRGKIFLDRFRNAKGATAVLPYSPRARPGLTVATPIPWTELGRVDPQELTVLTVPKLLARRRADPWKGVAGASQVLSRRILEAL